MRLVKIMILIVSCGVNVLLSLMNCLVTKADGVVSVVLITDNPKENSWLGDGGKFLLNILA